MAGHAIPRGWGNVKKNEINSAMVFCDDGTKYNLISVTLTCMKIEDGKEPHEGTVKSRQRCMLIGCFSLATANHQRFVFVYLGPN